MTYSKNSAIPLQLPLVLDYQFANLAKSANGVNSASKALSEIARKYSMTVLMSNCVGSCHDEECVGKSSIWNSNGNLVIQLGDADEGIIILDTKTQEVKKH